MRCGTTISCSPSVSASEIVRPEEIAQWGMINDQTLAKFPKLQRLIARLPNPALGRPGGRLEFYERQDGELGLIEEWDHDENTIYLLRRLRDVAERFRDLFREHRGVRRVLPGDLRPHRHDRGAPAGGGAATRSVWVAFQHHRGRSQEQQNATEHHARSRF